MPRVRLPDGESVPALGQGTWMMGASDARVAEAAALRRGVELGLTLIDTAEIYGDGAAEELVGDALSDWRDRLFLVSKVRPGLAGREHLSEACEASLDRLKTDRIDLYLLHWRDARPLGEIVEGMERLKARGLIRRWGVSNFDVADMEQLVAEGGQGCAANQVLYNLSYRGVEFDLMGWMAARGMPLMAYSPVEKGRLLGKDALVSVARRHGVTPAQVALAWTLRGDGVISIPKAAQIGHVEENATSIGLRLGAEDLATLDEVFPNPTRKIPLEMI
jgi:diketogulonate reductase-like aldo/keto reductase